MSAFGSRVATIVEMDIDRCTLTFGVAPCGASGAAGTECYNTFATCQAKSTYVKGTHTFRFCERGTPMPTGAAYVRPYIDNINTAPTKLSADKGLAVRESVSVKMIDEAHEDIEQDPYYATRAKAQGTFWRRFIVRNPHAVGRTARIKRALVTPPYSISGAFTESRYIIDKISGPNADGSITFTFRDVLALTKDAKIPAATDGKLSLALAASGETSIVLATGNGAQYADPATSGKNEYVTIDKEIIRYTAKSGDTLTIPNETMRAQFGSTAATHAVNAGVQQARAWIGKAVWEVARDLMNASGVTDSLIDLVQIQAEDAQWLGSKSYITACIAKPEAVDKLLAELIRDMNAYLWFDPIAQKVKLKVDMPALTSETVMAIDLSNQGEGGSLSVARMNDNRLTRSAVYFSKSSPTDNDDLASYARARMTVDTDAESANEYGAVKDETIKSRWLTDNNEGVASALASRRVSRRRSAPVEHTFTVFSEDAPAVGALVDLTSKLSTLASGAPSVVRARVVSREDDGVRSKITAREGNYKNRYIFIAPNGTPDYTSATAEQRARYGFICVTATQKMSNGDEHYRVI